MRLPPTPDRDRLLAGWVGELLACDPRLSGLDVTARVDGGVVHVAGSAPDACRLAALRDLLGRLSGVHGVWDHVVVTGERPLRALEVGSGGSRQHPSCVGLDLLPLPGVDVVADLATPLPVRTASVDRLYAVHVLEHVPDLLATLDELHRVLAPAGVLHVLSPDRAHVNAWADPTHVRFLDVQTFKYLTGPRPGHRSFRVLHASTDGTSVFADLAPSPPGAAAQEGLHRWFT